jgi:hypothetical protein
MLKRSISIAIILTLLIGCSFLVVGVQAQRQTINSVFTASPPIIDGQFSPSDTWSIPQLVLTQPDFPIDTFVYFMHDYTNLYVLVDAVGDTTDNGSAMVYASDQCLLVFNYSISSADWVPVRIIGNSTVHTVSSEFQADIGFTGSPNNPTPHKIYEFSIPLDYINATAGSPLDFCSPYSMKFGPSMPYDATDGRDNIWPPGLDPSNIYNADNWGIVTLPLPAVGGEIISVSSLILLAPWIALTIAALAIGFALMRKNYT